MSPNETNSHGHLDRGQEESDRRLGEAGESTDAVIDMVDAIRPPIAPPAPAGEPEMSRKDLAARAVLLDQVAAAAREESQQLRARLQDQARNEFEREGTAPTWRMPDLGTVSLSISQTRVVVTDEVALTKYVTGRYPGEIEPRIRPAFAKALLEQLVSRDGDNVIDDEGTVVPGLAVRHGGQPGSISVRASADAKGSALQEARHMLAAILDGWAEPHSEELGEVAADDD